MPENKKRSYAQLNTQPLAPHIKHSRNLYRDGSTTEVWDDNLKTNIINPPKPGSFEIQYSEHIEHWDAVATAQTLHKAKIYIQKMIRYVHGPGKYEYRVMQYRKPIDKKEFKKAGKLIHGCLQLEFQLTFDDYAIWGIPPEYKKDGTTLHPLAFSPFLVYEYTSTSDFDATQHDDFYRRL